MDGSGAISRGGFASHMTRRREREESLENTLEELYMAGVGTELIKLLKRIGFKTCGKCAAKANEWNIRGVEWCENNRDELIAWFVEQANNSNVLIIPAATKLAVEEPGLAARIATAKLMHPFTDVPLLAAGCIVDFAIDKANEEADAPRPPGAPRTVVLNANKHGFGDACVTAWISEGSRTSSVRLVHHATNKKKEFLEMLGQEVVERQKNMIDTFRAYSTELKMRGDPPRVYQRGRFYGIEAKPVRPRHTLTKEELQAGRDIADGAFVMFPNTDYGSREWPPFYWLELAKRLANEGHRVLFMGGKSDPRYEAFPCLWGKSWRENAAIMLAARVVVGNDSGPAHLAGTLDVPTLALLGPTTPSVFVQYPSVTCLAAKQTEIGCVGCYFHAPFGKTCESGCVAMGHLLPSMVFDAAMEATG